MLLQGLEAVDNNDKNTELPITCKRRWAITNTEKKAVQDYYFDPANNKPVYKLVQKWFLQ